MIAIISEVDNFSLISRLIIFRNPRLKVFMIPNFKGIIEGDQIELADFSLESFAYLTGLVTVNHNAGSNSARSHIANRQEA